MSATKISLRDLGVLPGQARHEELELELVPYVQGAIEYADDHGGGKAPKSSIPAPVGIVYTVPENHVPAQLDISVMTEGLAFHLRFEATFSGPCARCLEPATWRAAVDSHVVHDADSDEEDLRSDHVDDKLNELDVSAWAREEVGLRFPTRVLCRKDCRGLCGQCGVNLNDEPDHGHEKPLDTRWEALKDLQLDASEGETSDA